MTINMPVVVYAMAAIMALAALVALRGLRRGVQDDESRVPVGSSRYPQIRGRRASTLRP